MDESTSAIGGDLLAGLALIFWPLAMLALFLLGQSNRRAGLERERLGDQLHLVGALDVRGGSASSW